MENNDELFAVYTEDYKPIYSNIKALEQLDIQTILKQENDSYALRKIGDEHYMLFSSQWSINHKVIYLVNSYKIDSIYEEKERQMNQILWTDIGILAISTIVIYAFSVFLTNPIHELNQTSKKIASGRFSERVSIKAKDEIGELAESFNKMADEVEQKINELHHQIKQKNDFVSAFTHELKTPMTAIVGYSDLLRLKKCDTALTQKATQYIFTEAKRLEKLAFKLMQIQQLTDEKIEITSFSITHLMQKIAKAENSRLTQNKLQCEIEPAILKGESDLIEVVIRNLIENANKAEPKDQIIFIQGKKIQNRHYEIAVIDQGKGIPKEHITRVTEEFYRVNKARNRQQGGSGIGLSLVKKILDLHGTNLEIKSEEEVGTVVSFVLEEEET